MKDEDNVFKYSNLASGIGRQIVFAFIIVAWGSVYSSDSKELKFDVLPIVAIVVSMIYLGIDLCQYFFTTIHLRRINLDCVFGLDYAKNEEEKEDIEKQSHLDLLKVEKKSFKFFFLKFIILGINLLVLIFYFMGQLL